MNRLYGRQYVIEWDDEVGRYHVTLGQDSIGFHRTPDGAQALAATHARRVSLFCDQTYGVTVRVRASSAAAAR